MRTGDGLIFFFYNQPDWPLLEVCTAEFDSPGEIRAAIKSVWGRVQCNAPGMRTFVCVR